MEMRAKLGDLGITFIQEYEILEKRNLLMSIISEPKTKRVTNKHKVLWKKDANQNGLISVEFDIANRKLKNVCEDKSQFVD